MKASPPNWMFWFLRKICHEDLAEAVEGDLIALFSERSTTKGRRLASFLFLLDTLQFLQPFSFKTSHHYRMIYKTYLLIILRNMARKKFITAINILGMTLAIVISMAIYAYVIHEMSYDRYHTKSDRIYRMTYRYENDKTGYDIHWARMNGKWFNNLPEEFHEISSLVRFQSFRERDVIIEEEKFREKHAYAIDKDVFSLFDYVFIKGNAQSAFASPYSTVLTESTAKRYFGDLDPIGKQLRISADNGDKESYMVTAIIQDPPPNTHLPVTLFTEIQKPEDRDGWAYSYILLAQYSGIESVEERMPDYLNEGHTYPDGERLTVHFMPVSDIHLHSHASREIVPNGDYTYVLVFCAVAIFLLTIATVNFANLNTIQSLSRSKEIGLRKVMGAQTPQLKMYFFLEAFTLSGISAIAATILFIFTCKYLEIFMGYAFIFNWQMFAFWTGFTVVCVTLVSATMSAQLLTKGNASESLRGNAFSDNKTIPFRRVLIGIQFIMAMLLVSCTIIIQRQFQFTLNKDLGFDKEQIMVLTNNSLNIMRSYESLSQRLRQIPGIMEISAISEIPSVPIKDMGQVSVAGKPEINISADLLNVDINTLEVMNVKVLAGENLPFRLKNRQELPELKSQKEIKEYVMLQERAYLINKSAMKAMGWQTPEEVLGERMSWSIGNIELKKGPILGVIEDFHQESLKEKIDPLVITYEPVWFRHVLVKTSAADKFQLHNAMEQAWDELFPDLPMQLGYLDQEYDDLYNAEKKQLQLISAFTGIAIFIAFLGLYGMIAFALKTRTKELAIRRILGSNWGQVIHLLGKEYFALAGISTLISIPLAWWMMSSWLGNYAYRVEISGIGFALAVLAVIIILIASLSFHVHKHRNMNPAEDLRSE